MNPDPVAALRAVLAENAKVKHLEEENAYLRKHNASAELDAVQDALNEHPASPDIGDLSMAEQVRQIIKWWDETEVENNDAHNALDELGASDEGAPAERIRALAAAKDRQIAELEAKVRALAAERTQRPAYLDPQTGAPACPACGCAIHYGGFGGEGDMGAIGWAHCSRSTRATVHPRYPMIADGGCEWTGCVRRLDDGQIELAEAP